MTRNLKALGLALVAAFAMSALAAASASATGWQFHSEASTTSLIGTQEDQDVFDTTAGSVECDDADYTGTQDTSTAASVSVVPIYGGCGAFGVDAEIHTNSCEYVFTAGTIEEGRREGSVSIECESGDDITITAESVFGTDKCTVHVPPQGPLPGVTFKNAGAASGSTREVTVEVEVEGIEYIETRLNGSGFGACNDSTMQDDGTYVGSAIVTGKQDPGSNHVGIFIS